VWRAVVAVHADFWHLLRQHVRKATSTGHVWMPLIPAGELVAEALELGIASIMFDAAERAYEANVEATRAIAERCHGHGARVEGELGAIGGKAGAAPSNSRTDPAQAPAYISATRVDALAVAVGSSHQMADRVARLDLPLIRRLREAVPAPLVLHGSSGVPDADLAVVPRRRT
jgi:fructose-bisphosphate aldolase class II